jgi:protein-disulfide isomerase
MKNQPNKSSSLIPMLIIIAVLAGVVGGSYYLYRQSKPAANSNQASATPVPRSTVDVTRAPIGANPPQMLGSPTAAVTLEEFADFQCGACAATHPVLKEIQSTYGSRIRFVFRQFPLSGHDKAYDAAVATEAAGMQGKFWQMQDQLFTNQAIWTSPSANSRQLWRDYAEKIGLDVQRWESDMAGMSAKSRVDLDMARGKALNVGSTPSVFINNQLVPHPEVTVAGLRRIIDAELQKTAGAQTQTSAPAAPSR